MRPRLTGPAIQINRQLAGGNPGQHCNLVLAGLNGGLQRRQHRLDLGDARLGPHDIQPRGGIGVKEGLGQRQRLAPRRQFLHAQGQKALLIAQIDIGIAKVRQDQEPRGIHLGIGDAEPGVGGAHLVAPPAIGIEQPGRAERDTADIGHKARAIALGLRGDLRRQAAATRHRAQIGRRLGHPVARTGKAQVAGQRLGHQRIQRAVAEALPPRVIAQKHRHARARGAVAGAKAEARRGIGRIRAAARRGQREPQTGDTP